MSVFDFKFTVKAPLEAIAEFHHSTQALRRLTPPPVIVQLHKVEPLAEGSLADFTMWFGPLPLRWLARHSQVDAQHGFTDEQVKGPLAKWVHTHRFDELDESSSQVHEHIEFEHFKGLRGLLTRLLFSPPGLTFMFTYRAWVTRRAVENRTENRFD
jgi:ligand-binding SRPBCC domain-containing protein